MLIVGLRLHVALSGRPHLEAEAPISLLPRPDEIHLFDAQSGNRLTGNSLGGS